MNRLPPTSILAASALAAGALALSGCATPAGPVEVTRFVEPTTLSQLGSGTIFVETAPGEETGSLELSPYKAAVARELVQLGYRETTRDQASQIAQVSVDRGVNGDYGRRSPVSVGVGGSTGTYGSGVGLGVGINLGGGGGEEVSTRMRVMIRDAATQASLWEGRAMFDVSSGNRLAATQANASAVADALFREFPGNNGETVAVRVAE